MDTSRVLSALVLAIASIALPSPSPVEPIGALVDAFETYDASG